VKRFLDFVIAALLILALSPILVLVTILVLARLGFPPFFVQRRPGLDEELFPMIKFRTMSNARDGAGNLLPNEERLGSFGRFLRSTSLDELPELLNVLAGQMSLVGPRPLLREYLPFYSDEQRKRHSVRPGITGWAQINGRNTLSWEEKFALDVWYVENQSMVLDLKILALTLINALKRKDITTRAGGFTRRFDEEMKSQGKG
jgi:lipopolysaccharide/colanic/teichoic acid biosynthesis glycosyltransferase